MVSSIPNYRPTAGGAGGMGVVFRARDTKLQRDVALKLLPDHIAHDADLSLDGRLMAVPIRLPSNGQAPEPGAPVALFTRHVSIAAAYGQ